MIFLLNRSLPKVYGFKSKKMTISINNQEQIVSANSSIASILEELCLSKDGIAIAVNNEIITKSEWSQTLIKGKDTIIIIQATQGG